MALFNSFLSMALALLTFLIGSIPLLLLLLLSRRHRCRLPPGPKPLPIIGNLHQLSAGAPHLSLSRLAAEHGPLMFLRLGSIPTLVISSSAAAHAAFSRHDKALSGRPPLFVGAKLSYGLVDVVFAPHGEYWRRARKVYALELLSGVKVRSFRAIREDEVDRACASVRRQLPLVDLSETALALANGVVCRTAFGEGYAGGIGLRRVLAEAQELLGGFCAADFFPWLRWIHEFDGLRARVDRVFNELDGFYEQVIEEHRRDRPDRLSESEDVVDVLLRLLEDPAQGKTFNSKDHVKALLTDIFVAGTDTSAATIVWTMTELMRNPRVMNLAQNEVRGVVGNRGKVDEPDLQNLPYLKLVNNESFRVHPPAPLLVPRETTEPCTIDGYEIPTGTRVFVNALAIGQDPASWSDPEEFRPERFSNREVDFGGSCFDFIPFGVGRRSCPGAGFAVPVVELALANLLHCFDWELPDGAGAEEALDMEAAIGITAHKKKPLRLVAKAYTRVNE